MSQEEAKLKQLIQAENPEELLRQLAEDLRGYNPNFDEEGFVERCKNIITKPKDEYYKEEKQEQD